MMSKLNDNSNSSQTTNRQGGRSKVHGGAKGSDNQTIIGDPDNNDSFPDSKIVLKPQDQLQLTDQELKEEHTRILTAVNPHAPKNIVRYSNKERMFKMHPVVDQLAVHLTMGGNLIHVESEEGKKQLALQQQQPQHKQISTVNKTTSVDVETNKEPEADKEADTEALKDGDNAEDIEEKRIVSSGSGREKKLTNQFNFSERASQTYNNLLREQSTLTEPPPTGTFAANVTQWEIHDAYQLDFEKSELNREKKATTTTFKKDAFNRRKLIVNDMLGGDDLTQKIGPSAKIIERMVNQNTFDEVTQDFRYYEDAADEFRGQEGTLLPLWRFHFEKIKKMVVTSLCWNPKYSDLCAVGYGSYDFLKQSSGMVLLYSLKNPSYPEYVFQADSSVMSLDINPQYSYLIACGLYDGNVAVYNVLANKAEPLYISNTGIGKHTEPVWQIKWHSDDIDNNLNFFSLSSDGRVVAWTVLKNEMHCHDVMRLSVDGGNILESGTAFDFHSSKNGLFLVGTEEGKVHICSKAYSNIYIKSFETHHMAVYKVAWNPYHDAVFITCSADWTVKIWDTSIDKREPVFMFDLGSSVGDVAWAPYSSTVFAAVTADGRMHVFDLNVNKYEAICEQIGTTKKKTKLTHIAFNSKHPVIIVGDERGYVSCFKLSPNLRKMPKEKKGQDQLKGEEKEALRRQAEYEKMERILTMVRHADAKKET